MARYLVAQNPGPAGPPRPDPDFGYDVWDTHRDEPVSESLTYAQALQLADLLNAIPGGHCNAAGDELVVCDGFRVVRYDLGAWRDAR